MPSVDIPRRLATAPPRSARVVRTSAGRLLIEEKKTFRALRAAAYAATATAVAHAALRDGERDKAALLALILAASHRMSTSLQHTLQLRRQATRRTATARAGAELSAALGALVALANSERRRLSEDAYAAQTAADSLALAWRSAASAAATDALRTGDTPYRSIARLDDMMEPRLGRTASTETVDAYNDEHVTVVREYAEDAEDALTGSDTLLVRRWEAILDRRTCPECAAHDGELTGLTANFDSGDEPPLHPWCRCITTIVSVPRQ